MPRVSPAAAARAAMPERYGTPPRWHTPVTVAVAAVVAVAGVSWLLWAATVHSTPDVDGGVTTFEVVSDQRTDVTLEVHRGVASAVACEVYAQAEDKAIVGELTVHLEPAPAGTMTSTVHVATERRAAVAVLRSCRLE